MSSKERKPGHRSPPFCGIYYLPKWSVKSGQFGKRFRDAIESTLLENVILLDMKISDERFTSNKCKVSVCA